MQTEAPKQSPNTSPSDGEAAILRISLHAAGISTDGMNVDQMRERHRQHREQADKANIKAEMERERQLMERAEQAQRQRAQAEIERKRDALFGIGIDASKMTPDEINAACQAERERREAEARRRQGEALFLKTDCPDRHVLHVDAIDANPKWNAARDTLLDRIGNGYLVALLGPRGTGKTQLCVNVIRDCCRRMMSARYVVAFDLFREIRGTFKTDGPSEIKLIDGLTALDLLVIDECHQRGETAFENNVLVNLLDRRYRAVKSTVLIANQNPEDFAKSMGDSIVSRIHECGEAMVCDWPSYRKPGAWNGVSR